MNSILKDQTDIRGYKREKGGSKTLGFLLRIPLQAEKNDGLKEELLALEETLAKEGLTIVVLSPKFEAGTVFLFEKENSHILRLDYKDDTTDSLLPYFLKNEEGYLVGIETNHGDELPDSRFAKEVLLEVDIPRYDARDITLPSTSFVEGKDGVIYLSENVLSLNPSLTKEALEERIRYLFQAKEIIWIKEDKDENISSYLTTLSDGTIALDKSKVGYLKDRISEAETILLPEGYGELFETENKVLLPTYGEESDTEAIKLLSDHFQGKKEIVSIPFKNLKEKGYSLSSLLTFIPYSEKYEIIPKEDTQHRFY